MHLNWELILRKTGLQIVVKEGEKDVRHEARQWNGRTAKASSPTGYTGTRYIVGA